MKFELWKVDGGVTCFSIPCCNRMRHLREESPVLLARFAVEDPKEISSVVERYLYNGNPDGVETLNIPFKSFTFMSYGCGLKAGDVVEIDLEPSLSADVNLSQFPKGLLLRVVEGDSEYPELVWMEVVDRVGAFQKSDLHSLPNDSSIWRTIKRRQP